MNPAIAIKIKELSERYYRQLQQWRHHLHRRPELSFDEHQTQQYLSGELAKLGIRDIQTVAGTGLLARLEGKNTDGKTLVLRADTDALPVNEENDIPYRSQHPGIMHACGHDVHMTCLLGAARILGEIRDHWHGTVLLLFQPAEEKVPGGAKEIVEGDVLTPRHPDLILGQHVDPTLGAGTVGYRPGRYMASSDELYLTITGHGGHAALPGKVTNTPYIAAQILIRMVDLVAQEAPDDTPSVLRFGRVEAPGATNVIPDTVHMEGTFRTFDETWRNRVHEKITAMAKNLAEQNGAEAGLEIRKGYPVLENDPAATSKAINFSAEYLGEEKIRHLDRRMTSEDFAYYSRVAPSLFFRLGVSPPGVRTIYPLHSPRFDIHEPVLATGAGHLAWLTYSFLQEERR